MKPCLLLLVAGALLRCASGLLRGAPAAALQLAGNRSKAHRSVTAFIQRGGSTEESTGMMMMDLISGKLSAREVMSHIDKRMNIQEAMNRLEGKLPSDVATLFAMASRVQGGQSPPSSSDSIVEAVTVLRGDGGTYPIPKEAQGLSNYTINMTGIIPSSDWSLNFLTGDPPEFSNDVFHLSVRSGNQVVVRNAMLGGVWGGEERGGGFTFPAPNSPTEVLIKRTAAKWEVTVGGKRQEAYDFVSRSSRVPTAFSVVGSVSNLKVGIIGYQVPGKLVEESLQKARRILNDMIESSYKEMDDITIACAVFKDNNKKTFDQVTTDLARLGSESADLNKAIGKSLTCISQKDLQFKQMKETLEKEKNQFLKAKGENDALLAGKRNDLAVFDFLLDATKCPDSGKVSLLQRSFKSFLQMNATDDVSPNVCESHDGEVELKFDDQKVEERVLSMMTDDARLALKEALGLALATRTMDQASLLQTNVSSVSVHGQVPVAALGLPPLYGQKLFMTMEHKANTHYNPNIPWQCHRYESGQMPMNDNQCKTAGTIGDLQYQFFGAGGPCGSCWCCKRPRVCTVTAYEHTNFAGWSATYEEGSYPFSTFLAKGAKNDQLSAIKVDGPCVAVLFENDLWSGWQAVFPQGSYDVNGIQARGARNDQASSLIVFPEGYVAAQKACTAKYGQCQIGGCGYFTYFYSSNSQTCDCNKPVGQMEFVFKNTGYARVGDDYGGGGDDVRGVQVFRREKMLAGCSKEGIWKASMDLAVTTTPVPPPTNPPKPVSVTPKPSQQYKRCTPIKDDSGTCGLLHDTMSLQWGKFKDEVDQLMATMSKNQDTWDKLSNDINEQLQMVTESRGVCQSEFSESTADKNILVEEAKKKELQKKALASEYDSRMASCKARLDELLFTDVCAVRTVRNKLMEQSADTPPDQIVDCEVGDWVGAECSVPCDDSCPALVGGLVDPSKCGGTQLLTRTAIVSNNANGFRCPPLTRSRKCGQYKCAVDCKVSEWSGWSKCSKECEGGSQQQTRSILAKPRNGGEACPSTVDSRSCNMQSCDRDCVLADWSAWSPCSMACNPGGAPGYQDKKRIVLVPIRGEGKCPKPDSAQRYFKEACNEQACKGDEVCVAKQDLLIAVDASGSLQQSGFEAMKRFVVKLLGRYKAKHLGATAVRVGLILFGNGAKSGSGSIAPAINVIGLTDDLAGVENKVNGLVWQKGFTNMAQAFVLADTMLTERGRGSSAQSAVLMLSDGRYSFAFETNAAVQRLKEKGTRIMFAPIADMAGQWQVKLKEWASDPWETNYQFIPGFDALNSNLDFFSAEMVARFCPLAISPSVEAGQDDAKGFMVVRQDGLPDPGCAQFYDLGFVSRPRDCMLKVSTDMGFKAFSVSEKMQQGRRCFAQDMRFTKTNYTMWKSSKKEIPCPGGGWVSNELFDTYAIEPLIEDAPTGTLSLNSTLF